MATSTPPPTPPEDKEGASARPTGSLFDSDLAGTVRQSAQQIWLAGLGAFAKAQEEGTKVFEALVREGTSLQRRTTQPPPDNPAAPSSPGGSGFASQATQQWDRLESIFEDRVAKALHRLGVPSLKAMATLQARVDELDAEVARLSGRQAAPRTPSAPPQADDIAPDATPEPGAEAR